METLKQEELVHIDLWAVVRRMMPIVNNIKKGMTYGQGREAMVCVPACLYRLKFEK